ncbi:hypothetical protein [Bradyrhizobium diazoefficiens]
MPKKNILLGEDRGFEIAQAASVRAVFTTACAGCRVPPSYGGIWVMTV